MEPRFSEVHDEKLEATVTICNKEYSNCEKCINYLQMSMIKYWNRAQEAVGSPFLDIFITWLKQGPDCPEQTACLEQESGVDTSRSPFQLCSADDL